MHRPASSPSSRGLGHRPFTAATGVRIPLGTPTKTKCYRLVVKPSGSNIRRLGYGTERTILCSMQASGCFSHIALTHLASRSLTWETFAGIGESLYTSPSRLHQPAIPKRVD